MRRLARMNLLGGAEGIVRGRLDEDLPGAGLKIEEVEVPLGVGNVLEADQRFAAAAIDRDQNP